MDLSEYDRTWGCINPTRIHHDLTLCRRPRHLSGTCILGIRKLASAMAINLRQGMLVDRVLGHDGSFPQLVFDRISLVINGLQRARNTIRGLFILGGGIWCLCTDRTN